MPRLLSVNRSVTPSGELSVTLGHDLLDDYLTFLAGRVRPNSLLAAAFDLKVFFSFVQKEPAEVTSGDVIGFITSQRAPRISSKVVRISDGGSGLSARTVARRLSSISGLYAYLIVKGDAGVHTSPVPRGLITRRARRNGGRAAPLVRSPRVLPRILENSSASAMVRNPGCSSPATWKGTLLAPSKKAGDEASLRMASNAVAICNRSSAVRMPTRSSARANACEPRISASRSRRSKSSDPEKCSKISDGPFSKRPPQSFIGIYPPARRAL